MNHMKPPSFYHMNIFNKASFKANYHMKGKLKIETWSLIFVNLRASLGGLDLRASVHLLVNNKICQRVWL